MAPPKKERKGGKPKKEKVFHPQSRKADQLVRTQIRKNKLTEQARARTKKHGSQVDLSSFFYHAIPPEGALTLEDLHMIIRDVWLCRFDSELESEKTSRRKGRPKSTKEQKLEEQKTRETELYRTGMEVVDLTDPPNVELFRQWDQKEAAYIQQLRFIRISSSSPEVVTVSRPGKHPSLKKAEVTPAVSVSEEDPAGAAEMDVDEVPLLLAPS